MIGFILCFVALAIAYATARKSLVYGIFAVLTVGYLFGIVRANLPETTSYLIFDAAVIGFYAARVNDITKPFLTYDGQRLKHWTVFLILWPLLLFFIPQQDMLVQLVGLRGNMFLLPFVLFGARLTDDDRYRLGVSLSFLNIGAFAVGLAEYIFGIEHFFPLNEITYLIYRSNDVGSMGDYRIPSVFSNAHSFGGTMVICLPLIAGAWVQPARKIWHKNLMLAGMLCSMLGVFMSAARTHFLVLLVVIAMFTLSARLRSIYRVGWLVLLVLVGYVVGTHERMQRFTTLSNESSVEERVESSVNISLLEAVSQYPFGNGLGGGGTSMPQFLIDRIQRPIVIESELGRIELETGLIGLAAWICFAIWIFSRPRPRSDDPWFLGVRLAWAACLLFFLTGFIGIGLLTSIPFTSLLLMQLGWIATHHTREAELAVQPFALGNARPVLVQQNGMPRN